MLDINLIREKPEVVEKNLRKRNGTGKIRLLKEIKSVDKKWRKKLQKLQKLRHKKNQMTDKIGKLKQEGKEVKEKIKEMKNLSEDIETLEKEVKKLKTKRDNNLRKIPNILHKSVPKGKNEEDNIEMRRWGKPPEFDFKPKTHLEILRDLDMLDLEKGAKVSGSGFYYLKGDAVLLDLAIQRFALDFLKNNGYKIVEPPFLVNKKTYEAMIGDIENLAEASYKVEDKKLWLIPTAEYPLGGMFMNKTFLESELPKKICGISPCFRREVGTHGKYSKGLYRVHQFNKIEQFIFSKPENSWDYHEELQKNAEKLYQKLGLHYRVVNVCTGDIGFKAAKKYDIECWMADGKFHETGSNSNCLDYQSRRLGIKYREGKGKPPKDYVHALNNTALATSRTIISIVEQNQEKNGTVRIPEVLRPYMSGIEKLK